MDSSSHTLVRDPGVPPEPSPPEPIDRPKLASWLWERGLDARKAARLLRCSKSQVTNFVRPFGDPGRRVPRTAQMTIIVEVTAGAVTAADFYPPHLRAARSEPAASPEAVS